MTNATAAAVATAASRRHIVLYCRSVMTSTAATTRQEFHQGQQAHRNFYLET